MRPNQQIAYTDDIARIVAKETGYSKEMVMDHIDFLSHWIKHLTENPKILNIRIPHVGYLYLNISRVNRDFDHFSKLPKDGMSKSWIKMLDKNKVRLETFGKEFDGQTGYNRHKKRTKITNPYFTKKMSLKELEEWQNK